MSVFERVSYPAYQVLEDLIEELLYTEFIESLAFCPVYDQEDEDMFIEFYLEGEAEEEEEEEYLLSLYFDSCTQEFYYWMDVEVEDEIELSSKVFIHSMEQLVAVVNNWIEKLN